MKKILTIALLLSSLSPFANIGTLPTVKDFKKYRGTATTLYVEDRVQGGFFTKYVGAELADGGMVFIDSSKRKWLRLVQDDRVMMKWYGVIPYTNYDKDVAAEINKAIGFIKRNKQQFGTLQLDACMPNTWYLVGSKINLSGIKFYGAGGQGRQPSTLFQILAGVQPFDIRGEYADVRDIAVRHYAGNVLDSFNHTFKIRTVVRFENVNIISNQNGNGYDISGCGPASDNAPDSIFGNPDHSIFINCQASACLNGAELKGCDANAILFQNCNFAQNAKWGVFDNGFLGNTYLTTHWASNSQVKNSGCRVNDTTFYPYPDSVYNIVGKYPPDNPTYWYKTNFTGGNEQWNNTRKYWGGGALWAANPNSNHAVISCYTEDFQANSIISPRSAWYEGTAGSPVVGGMWQHTFGGTTFFSGQGIQSPRVNTNAMVFPSVVNGALAETEFIKDPKTKGSATIVVGDQNGYVGNTRIKEYNREPTIEDITYNTSQLWSNTKDKTLKLYVNWGGGLVVLANYSTVK